MYFIQFTESDVKRFNFIYVTLTCLCFCTAATLRTIPTSFQLQYYYKMNSVVGFSCGL